MVDADWEGACEPPLDFISLASAYPILPPAHRTYPAVESTTTFMVSWSARVLGAEPRTSGQIKFAPGVAQNAGLHFLLHSTHDIIHEGDRHHSESRVVVVTTPRSQLVWEN